MGTGLLNPGSSRPLCPGPSITRSVVRSPGPRRTYYCRQEGFPVVGRMIGGGQVYLDSEQLFVRFCVEELPKRPERRYSDLLSPVAVLDELGVDGNFRAGSTSPRTAGRSATARTARRSSQQALHGGTHAFVPVRVGVDCAHDCRYRSQLVDAGFVRARTAAEVTNEGTSSGVASAVADETPRVASSLVTSRDRRRRRRSSRGVVP